MSEGERALRALLRSSDASARLQTLVSHASPAGRLYALLGLRVHDRTAYTLALEALRIEDGKVDTMRGCIIGAESFHALVSEIKHGKYDSSLSHPRVVIPELQPSAAAVIIYLNESLVTTWADNTDQWNGDVL